jgi:polar amino acid transport system substrate-binding protein
MTDLKIEKGVFFMTTCITGTCGCATPKCPCDCSRRYGPEDLRRVWRVGTSADYEPFEFIDEKTGEIVGLDVDLINLIAERLRFKVHFQHFNFDYLLPALEVRYFDVIAAALTENEDRKKSAVFTEVYYESDMVLLYREGTEISWENLNNMVVAAQTETVQEDLLKKIKEEGLWEDQDEGYAPRMTIYTDQNMATLVNCLVEGSDVEVSPGVEKPIDAIMMNDHVADANISRQTGLARTVYDFLKEREACSLALPLGSSLLDEVDAILFDLEESGEIQNLIDTWIVSSDVMSVEGNISI